MTEYIEVGGGEPGNDN